MVEMTPEGVEVPVGNMTDGTDLRSQPLAVTEQVSPTVTFPCDGECAELLQGSFAKNLFFAKE